jgi:hypothetical protein
MVSSKYQFIYFWIPFPKPFHFYFFHHHLDNTTTIMESKKNRLLNLPKRPPNKRTNRAKPLRQRRNLRMSPHRKKINEFLIIQTKILRTRSNSLRSLPRTSLRYSNQSLIHQFWKNIAFSPPLYGADLLNSLM